MASASPRIAEARSRAASVKRAIVLIAVAGFLAVFVLARASHPGGTGSSTAAQSQSQTQSPQTVLVPVTGENDDGATLGFNFGSGSIAPSQPQSTAPSVQTHTS